MRLLRIVVWALLLPLARAEAPVVPATPVAFQNALEALAKSSGLNVGIAVQDLTSAQEFLCNADAVYPQGSSIRIHLVTELYRQAAAKKISLDEPRPLPDSARTGGTGVLRYMAPGSMAMTLRDYAVLMIAVNDHSAANFLTDVLGIDNINASLAAQGTPEIKFRRRAISRREARDAPENEATPRAVMRALALIHQGAVVDRRTSDAILEVLAVPEISYFRRELPRGIAFAGRSGSGPTMRCDAGIVLLPNRPFALCVMIKGLRLPISGPRDYSAADKLIGDVTGLSLRYFNRHGSDERRNASE